MLRGEFEDAADRSSESLQRAYEERLEAAIDTVGIERAVEETGIEEATLRALLDGESPALELTDAAAILALDEALPPADAIEAEARDILLMGMTTAVLDVETLSSGIDAELDPKEIQQKIEGRFPMTVREYALLHQYIEQRKG